MTQSGECKRRLSRWITLWVFVPSFQLVDCWQSPQLPPNRVPGTTWGNPYARRAPSMSALHSTAAPSSRKPETVPDNANSSEAGSGIETPKSEDTEPTTRAVGPFPKHTEQFAVDRLSMPWSEVQDWALRDNLPKYTIMIPLDTSNRIGTFDAETKAKDDSGSGTLVFALWRTMLKEVPELAGYPIDFLQEIHSRQISKNETRMQVTPQLLPYLEDYTFATAGGVSGKVYGVPGLADGTRIETSAVTNIEVTLPQGFVRTSDGKAAYELGRPQREEFSDNAVTKELWQGKASLGAATTGSYELLKSVKGATSELEDADGMLLRLGASTGILLAGATAVNLLSHHLTVNVFWV